MRNIRGRALITREETRRVSGYLENLYQGARKLGNRGIIKERALLNRWANFPFREAGFSSSRKFGRRPTRGRVGTTGWTQCRPAAVIFRPEARIKPIINCTAWRRNSVAMLLGSHVQLRRVIVWKRSRLIVCRHASFRVCWLYVGILDKPFFFFFFSSSPPPFLCFDAFFFQRKFARIVLLF